MGKSTISMAIFNSKLLLYQSQRISYINRWDGSLASSVFSLSRRQSQLQSMKDMLQVSSPRSQRGVPYGWGYPQIAGWFLGNIPWNWMDNWGTPMPWLRKPPTRFLRCFLFSRSSWTSCACSVSHLVCKPLAHGQVIPCIIKGLSISPDNVELWNRGDSLVHLEEPYMVRLIAMGGSNAVNLFGMASPVRLVRFDRRLRPSLLFAGLRTVRMVSSEEANVRQKNIEHVDIEMHRIVETRIHVETET